MSSNRSARNRSRLVRPAFRAALEALEPRQLLTVTLASATTGGAAAEPPGAGAVGSMIMSPAISDDGQVVVFVSEAANLVAGDANGQADLFVRNRTTGETRLVSAAAGGAGAGDGKSGDPGGNRTGYAVSGNGRFVVFASDATNLVAGQTDGNGLPDYFVRDLQTNTTALVTATASGGYSTSSAMGGTNGRPAISDDGRFVAFTSTYADLDADATDADDNAADVFVRDTTSGVTRQLSKTADGQPGLGAVGASPSISADGRYVAFTSNDKLVAGAPDFSFEQVWVHDTTTNAVVHASPAAGGAGFAGGDSTLPRISGDGRSVAFLSVANDLVPGFVDNNGAELGAESADLYLRDLDANTTTLVSHDAGSAAAGGSDTSRAPSLSADGRFVAYVSRAKNLVAGVADANEQSIEGGGEDVFLFDATSGQTTMLSVTPAGTAAGARPSFDPDGDAERGPAMSDDGRHVVFASIADDLVAGDANGRSELFVRDAQANTTRRLFEGLTLADGGRGTSPSISGSGNAIAFVGDGTGIVTAADVLAQQVFVDAAQTDGNGGTDGGNNGGNNGGTDGGTDGGGTEPPGSLAPTLFTALPTAALSGGKVRGAFATVTITNVAPEAYNGPVTVTLFASANGTLETAADPQVATVTKRVKIGSADATPLKIKIPSFPQVPEGDYVIIAQVSSPTAGTGVSTNDESIRLSPAFADLSGTFGALPATLAKGKRARLSLTVANAGNVDARGTVPVTIALSADPSGAGAATVATVNAKLSVKANASKPLKLNFTLPAEAPSGTFFVVATLGTSSTPPDTNATNNTVVSGTSLAIA